MQAVRRILIEPVDNSVRVVPCDLPSPRVSVPTRCVNTKETPDEATRRCRRGRRAPPRRLWRRHRGEHRDRGPRDHRRCRRDHRCRRRHHRPVDGWHRRRRRVRRRQDPRGRHAHDRHRRSRLLPVRDRRRPDHGPGVRVGRRAGRRPRARLRGRLGRVGPHGLRRGDRPRPQGLRLQPAAVHDHRGAPAGGRLQRGLLQRAAGRVRPGRLPRRQCRLGGRPRVAEDRRRVGHHQRHLRRRGHQARGRAVHLPGQRRREGRARERPDRRDRQRPPDRALHHRRRDRRHQGVRSDRGQRDRGLGPAARQGQPAHRVRRPRAPGAEVVRRARADHHRVDERVHRGPDHRRGLPTGPTRSRRPRSRPGPCPGKCPAVPATTG